MKQYQTWNRIGLAIICMVALLASAGCADLQGAINQTTAWRDNALLVEEALENQLEVLETKRQTLPSTSPEASTIDAAIADAQAKLEMLNAAINQATLVIEEATNPTDSLTQAADAIAPWVPAPAQGPLLLGAALIASMVRSQNLKRNATSIIQSIDHLLRADPQFKERFAQHANTIRTIQTPGARKLIDTTVRKSGKQPIVSLGT